MTLKVFVAFPEDDQVIIDIEEDWGVFIELLNRTVALLKSKNIKVTYDNENVNTFKERLVHLNDNYMQKASHALRIILGVNAEDLTTNPIKKTDHHYFEYVFNPLSILHAEKSLAEMAERQVAYELEKYLIFNSWNHYTNNRSKILVFKDALQSDLLPYNFISLENMVSFDELDRRLENFQNNFSLSNSENFERTSFLYHGKAIYREKNTNRYWYLDNFHKDEYEIFDENGKHIGTANLNGNVDYSTAVSGRRIAVN